MIVTFLKDLKLSTEMIDASEISSTLVHKNGTQDIGNINLSGNILLGDGLSTIPSNITVKAAGEVYVSDLSGQNSVAVGGCALGKNSVAIGYQDRGTYRQCAVADGFNATAIGQTSYAHGKSSVSFGGKALGDYAITLGGGIAYGYSSVAQGANTRTGSERDLITEEFGKNAHAEGAETSAFGWASHAEGYATYSYGRCSHADGCSVSAMALHSIASGTSAIVLENDSYAYVWGGRSDIKTPLELSSNGPRTFSIYPKGGLNGFYIDGKSLSSILQDTVGNINDVLNKIVG